MTLDFPEHEETESHPAEVQRKVCAVEMATVKAWFRTVGGERRSRELEELSSDLDREHALVRQDLWDLRY